MNDTSTRNPRRTKAERRAHYCAICEPDADNKTGSDHPTGDHDKHAA